MTEKKGRTKRQHYVPRMILRNFSRDEKRISLLVNGQRIDDVPLRDQCQEDYFYGADQIMENSFANEEAKMSGFFGDLAPERFENLDIEQVGALQRFVAYQHARTRGAAEHLSKFSGAFAKATLRGTISLNADPSVSSDDLEKVEIGLEDAQNEAIWQMTKSLPVMFDLSVKFISTDRTPGFVIADHPVVAYNQFAEHHPVLSRYPTSTALGLKGLQLFMPLSPSMMLALFDPTTYAYGGKGIVCKAGPADVRHLNQMQAVNAHSCVYFDAVRMTDRALDDLVEVRKTHPPIYEKHAATSPMIRKADGTVSQFVAIHQTEVRLRSKLSFIRTTDGHSYEDYEGPSVPIRSQELFELAGLFGQKLEDEVATQRAKKAQNT